MSSNTKDFTLTWTKLIPQPDPDHGVPLARSSHGVSYVNDMIFVYGGEHIARTPIDNNNDCWIMKNNQWKKIVFDNKQPPSRIAHAQAVYQNRYVYIFGGRAGITMNEKAMNDLWVLDTETMIWNEIQIDESDNSTIPEARSFHKMICIDHNLYVFGGCGAISGRLNDMYKFDITTKTWHNLGTTNILRGRGGPNVFPIQNHAKIAIVAGFAGEETADGHVLDVSTGKWHEEALTPKLEGLRPRSVCVSASFPDLGICVIFGGEVDPSDRGHEGAGGFENDLVILDENTGAIIKTIKADADSWPEQRGWSDADTDGKNQLFIYGGLSGDDANPRRLDDLWKLEIGTK